MVIGAGMSGITAAVEAAEAGLSVILLEKLPYIGGNAISMNRYFPKMCPPYCGMEINFRRIKDNPLISLMVSTEVSSVFEQDDSFAVELVSAPEYVNSNCTLCGDCVEVCKAEMKDVFNRSMSSKKAIYHPHDLAFPERYVIDDASCLYDRCNACFETCRYDAINLEAKPKETELIVGSIILATGWEGFDPAEVPDYSFGKHPDILTNLMMERISAPNGSTMGKILCHETQKAPKKIAFIHCVGSRDENHLPYCSGVCCSASLKQALHAVEVLPEVEVSLHYIDLRVSGRNEDFLSKIQDHPRIRLIKGKVSKVNTNTNNKELEFVAEDIESGKKLTYDADMLVLATGLIPNQSAVEGLLPKQRSYLDYYSLPDGVKMAGCAIQPMDISASVKSATGASLLGFRRKEE